MKISIRRNVFETNSSSTHNMTILSKEDFEKWQKGFVLDTYTKTLISEEEALCQAKKYYEEGNYKDDFDDVVDEIYRELELETFDHEEEYLETDVTEHKTKSGDEIVIICRYGYEG